MAVILMAARSAYQETPTRKQPADGLTTFSKNTAESEGYHLTEVTDTCAN
jgi:hypothetical protein